MLFLRGRTIRRQILCKICNNISGRLDRRGGPGKSGRSCGIDAGRVVYEVRGKERICSDFFIRQIAGQLVNNGGHNFHVSQFFSTCRGGAMEERVQNPCAARLCGVKNRRNGECAKTGVAV